MKTKIYLSALALSMAGVFCGSAQAATEGSQNRDIQLYADINDAIYVTKVDGATWYERVRLWATSSAQNAFVARDPDNELNDYLTVRVHTKDVEKFKVKLRSPLQITGGAGGTYHLDAPVVTFNGQTLLTTDTAPFTQATKLADDSYDNQYRMKITTGAAVGGTGGTNGSYAGTLQLVFETVI